MSLALAAALLAIGGGLLAVDLFPGLDRPRTVAVRLGLYRAAHAALADAPARGHGLGSYPVLALRHRDLDEARLEPRRRAFHAHNDYLHAGVEGGLPAALVLALALGVLIVGALRERGEDEPAGTRRVRAGAAGALVTLAVAALGDGVLVDPAPALVLAVALASVLTTTRRARVPAGSLAQVPLVAGALLALGMGYTLARDALADRDVMRYRDAIEYGVTPAGAQRAAERYLRQGALHWRADSPGALYRLGVHEASSDRLTQARATFRAALASDPGMTEARLDLAQVYQLEDRPADARAVLEEARRHDPTRYDVPRRIMELVLGPEPVPGDPPAPVDMLDVLRWSNEARYLAPGRFENAVDEARLARLRAEGPADLAKAGALLRAAVRSTPGAAEDPPAEILLESFHLAEAEDRAPAIYHSTILMQALAKNPRPARRYRAQAERFLDEGLRRQEAALARAGGDPTLLDTRSAERAFEAAAVRYTALLYVGREAPEVVLARARLEKEAGRWRRALVFYRSLLAWTLPPQGADRARERESHGVDELRGPTRLETIARQGDLLLEAAGVAQRVDRQLAAFYRTRGQLRIGVELLQKDQLVQARRKLESVLASDPNLADGRFALARVLARQGEEDAAEAHLLESLQLKPALRGPALAAPDLAVLRRRSAVKELLQLP